MHISDQRYLISNISNNSNVFKSQMKVKSSFADFRFQLMKGFRKFLLRTLKLNRQNETEKSDKPANR